MLGDVVKSKSKLLDKQQKLLWACFIVIFLISSSSCIKKIHNYIKCSQICQIEIESILWDKPQVLVTYKYSIDGRELTKTDAIKYLRIHTTEHFSKILPDLRSRLTTGYYSASAPEKVYLARSFPFYEVIVLSLVGLSFFLCLIYIKNFIL